MHYEYLHDFKSLFYVVNNHNNYWLQILVKVLELIPDFVYIVYKTR